MPRKTVLVVDDEPKIVEIVKSYLEKDGYDTVCAYDGNAALTLFDQCFPSLVILDLMLPGISGEDVCKWIRKKSRVPVIMLTAKTAEESMLEGLGIGADDYVTKPFSPRLLMAKIEAVLRRVSDEAVPLSNVLIFDGGDLIIDSLRHEVRKKGERVALTPNEYNILFTMAKYPTKAFTRDELISLALSDTYDGFDRIIDTHIKNLRQKIEDDSKNPRYILTVHSIGYSFGGR
ncbi:MAG: two component transcriptional regulator, winged helix family [Caproiciproducens sp.]|nr:two component transcriptional regulator, winged helix family [Caproiciproducens sp.]